MDLEKLIQMIYDGKYEDNSGDEHKILFWEEQRKAVSKIVYEWGAEQLGVNDLYKRLGELEAKCFAYEQIIAKSNFKPFVEKSESKDKE